MTPQFENEKSRMTQFKSLMEPILSHGPSDLVEDLQANGFFTAPASREYHGCYEGGLFDHSLNVTRALLNLTRDCNLLWGRSVSPYIIGMFHDLCKTDLYRHPKVGTVVHTDDGHDVVAVDVTKWEHSSNTLLRGHGDKSVMMLSRYFTLTMEEIACIRYHMGAFVDQKEWSDYTGAIHLYPNVLWVHHADMIATHIMEVEP